MRYNHVFFTLPFPCVYSFLVPDQIPHVNAVVDEIIKEADDISSNQGIELDDSQLSHIESSTEDFQAQQVKHFRADLEAIKVSHSRLQSEFQGHLSKTETNRDLIMMEAWSELERLQAEVDTLKSELEEKNNSSDFFLKCQHNTKLMKFYTSLTSCSVFEILFLALEPSFKSCKSDRRSLSLREQFFLTLVKLAHNLKEEDLAFRFRISTSTVSRYFQKWIHVIYHRLRKRVIAWPEREELRISMPMNFRKNFKDCVAIIDCFEIQIQIPHSPTDQASTYSSYKSRNTVKYLIASTPQGTVSFISEGYVGRASDLFVVQESGILLLVKPGDLILADRGFTIEDLLGLIGAKLATPAFMQGRNQLSQQETEMNRKVSNVRIHIERIIGCLRMRFEILRGPVDIRFLYNSKEAISFFDKIVTVCSIISNLNPSIVPSG